MCGRYVHPDQAAIERAWHIGRENGNPIGGNFKRRFNVTPTSLVPVLRRQKDSPDIELTQACWGFVPHWWKDAKAPRNTINARTEDIAQKPMWRSAIRQSRCLMPAQGWYEWQPMETLDARTGEIKVTKQPYFIRPIDGALVCFAALYSHRGPDVQQPIGSCSILTRASVGAAAQVHDRMPVVLSQEAFAAWLHPGLTDPESISQFLVRNARTDFECIAVSTQVNARGAEGEQLIQPQPPHA